MYAIIENGGKQYKITEGEKVKLEKFAGVEGEDIQIKEVLALNDGTSTIIGSPYIEGAYIQGKVVSQGRLKKVIVFKFKRRKDYKKKNGHRQHFTELLVEKIHAEASHGA
jgi:large subunit ribosomal protein L21